ncbi:6-phosphogluconate dehydrogenase C-terminal domain-like protein [Phialemonium atrogriseum]|uniref:6-phosphogluconate dehydrogenase C-terminal domain-like protein n=1 Tax=Phialemonium atrogriseum TaxID=1093897 RepID=A0AAJ0FQD6_9PEZI|nr:6-phosphogluconate dehydrogenase C-terminal domain-like protein [Phialemonium atrogriseum]KAK1769050.1 6-phosphogluconate dehydrogenase C-terminal domain-like protein [Phialemonium atrogriseum]
MTGTAGDLTRPPWLEEMLQDRSLAPRLFSWTLANLPGVQGCHRGQNKEVPTSGDSSKRFYVLGVGNLGRLFATALAKLPEPPPITLVFHKRSLLEQWASNPGIEITRSGTRARTLDFNVEWWTDQRPDIGPTTEICNGRAISNLIIATKAPDALPQVDKLRRYLNGRSTVAFVQNGMNRLWPPYGVEYNHCRYQPNGHPNWIACVATHGVTSLGTFRSLHASPADVAMGPVSLNSENAWQADYLMSQITAAPYLDARRVSRSDLWVLQLEKLIVNCIINPLTAILRCKNGVLFADQDGPLIRVMDVLLEEASRVLQTLVRDETSREILLDNDAVPDGQESVEMRLQYLLDRFSTARLRAMLHTVGEKVKDNTSSMLQDVMSGKKTEIREFNGWLIDTAGYLGGLDVEGHKRLIQLVENGTVLEATQVGGHVCP